MTSSEVGHFNPNHATRPFETGRNWLYCDKSGKTTRVRGAGWRHGNSGRYLIKIKEGRNHESNKTISLTEFLALVQSIDAYDC